MPYQEIDEARKVKEFFDPNFTSPIGVFFIENLPILKLLKMKMKFFSGDYSAWTCLSKNRCHACLYQTKNLLIAVAKYF
jgi:hypothetical protein